MSRYTLLNRIFPKVMAVLLVLTLLMSLAPAASAAEFEGTCGEELYWSFEGGTLTITGKGGMENYNEENLPPWYGIREQVLRLVLPEGLTNIGSMAFYGCINLASVEIPSSVREIGATAFSHCEAMAIVRLHEGLTTIGDMAFYDCASLTDLRLPGTLVSIGQKAFYRCASLLYVTVPASVTHMDVSVFAYCENLIRAEILAPLRELPAWTFFACRNLSSIYLPAAISHIGSHAVYDCENLGEVYYGGTAGDAEDLEEQITEGRDWYTDTTGDMTPEDAGNSESVSNVKQDENGDLVSENTTVTQTPDSTISSSTTNNMTNENASKPPVEITATILTEEGWAELLTEIEKVYTSAGVIVTVYVSGDLQVPASFLNALAGLRVTMRIVHLGGTDYTVDFEKAEEVSKKTTLDMSYSLKLAQNLRFQELEGVTVYELIFNESSQMPVSVAIQLPVEYARQTASLYQEMDGELEVVQSIVADQKGIAYFYLGAIDKKTTYYIGINVPWVSGTDVRVPDSLADDYGIDYQAEGVTYEITGRKSSWGIGFLEVNQILLGIMLSTAAFVGLAMYALNKRKIRKGILPGWDDVDDGES